LFSADHSGNNRKLRDNRWSTTDSSDDTTGTSIYRPTWTNLQMRLVTSKLTTAWNWEPERNFSLIVCDINWTVYRMTLKHKYTHYTRWHNKIADPAVWIWSDIDFPGRISFGN